MTEGFKYFLAWVLLYLVVAGCAILYIPTLGHSWSWFSRLLRYFEDKADSER